MRDREIKLAAFDLDGTLLTETKEITDYTRDVLRKAAEKGVHLVPATGRPLGGIPEEIYTIPGIRYIVSANGARITDIKEKRVLYERLVPYKTSLELLEIFRRYDTLLEVYYDGVGYAEADKINRIGHYLPDRPMADYIASTRKTVDHIIEFFIENRRPSDKIHAMFAVMEEKERAYKEASLLVDKIEMTGSLNNNIEVNGSGVNKGEALHYLGEHLGIRRGEWIAFGDGSNDIAMLKEAGIGIAMQNAVEEAKAAADDVTVSNEENGVAKAMEEYILK